MAGIPLESELISPCEYDPKCTDARPQSGRTTLYQAPSRASRGRCPDKPADRARPGRTISHPATTTIATDSRHRGRFRGTVCIGDLSGLLSGFRASFQTGRGGRLAWGVTPSPQAAIPTQQTPPRCVGSYAAPTGRNPHATHTAALRGELRRPHRPQSPRNTHRRLAWGTRPPPQAAIPTQREADGAWGFLATNLRRVASACACYPRPNRRRAANAQPEPPDHHLSRGATAINRRRPGRVGGGTARRRREEGELQSPGRAPRGQSSPYICMVLILIAGRNAGRNAGSKKARPLSVFAEVNGPLGH
jgi:hypothetical protein